MCTICVACFYQHLGLLLRGRFFCWPLVVGAVLFPLTALASLEAVQQGAMSVASWCFLFMAFAGLVLNVGSIPMVLRMVSQEKSGEALSLMFATGPAASIFRL